MSAPLIAQLGKNYHEGMNHLITGDELLCLACEKISRIQLDLGGRFVYVECEDKPKLIDFYAANGFFVSLTDAVWIEMKQRLTAII